MVCRTPSGKESTLTGKEDISVHYKRRPQVKTSFSESSLLHKTLKYPYKYFALYTRLEPSLPPPCVLLVMRVITACTAEGCS